MVDIISELGRKRVWIFGDIHIQKLERFVRDGERDPAGGLVINSYMEKKCKVTWFGVMGAGAVQVMNAALKRMLERKALPDIIIIHTCREE